MSKHLTKITIIVAAIFLVALIFDNRTSSIAETASEDNVAKYLGIGGCKACHFKQYKSWKKTKMAKTFEVLKPGVNAEAKTELKFDPNKDYTKDPECLSCHTTGYGMPGGYRIPSEKDTKAKKIAKENEGITCEACHGPGSLYVDGHKNVKDNKRKYTQEEFFKAGLYKIDAQVCIACHNQKNPTAGPDFKFDYKKHKTEDTHRNYPLKYRTE